MAKKIERVEPTVENIERSLVLIARIVLLHGEKYLPYVTFLETALVEAKAKEDIMARVRGYAKTQDTKKPAPSV